MLTNIEIYLQSFSYNNKYPKVKIWNNNELLGDIECIDHHTVLLYNITPTKCNRLAIEFYNKSFGENQIWDMGPTGELKLKILDIKFDGVSIDHLLPSLYFTTQWSPQQLKLQSSEFIKQYSKFAANGDMVFNGVLEFDWDMPIYDFLIEKKFKESYNPSLAFYSNKTELFHYEKGLKFLNEIKLLINENNS
jgi:hypothetical protein